MPTQGKGRLVEFITTNDILPEGLLRSLEHQKRSNAVDELETMLALDLTEAPWQQWFERNDWVLGTEFVRILEERPIDVEHIADYLMQAYDGFLDLVEIKRPEGVLKVLGKQSATTETMCRIQIGQGNHSGCAISL